MKKDLLLLHVLSKYVFVRIIVIKWRFEHKDSRNDDDPWMMMDTYASLGGKAAEASNQQDDDEDEKYIRS